MDREEHVVVVKWSCRKLVLDRSGANVYKWIDYLSVYSQNYNLTNRVYSADDVDVETVYHVYVSNSARVMRELIKKFKGRRADREVLKKSCDLVLDFELEADEDCMTFEKLKSMMGEIDTSILAKTLTGFNLANCLATLTLRNVELTEKVDQLED